MSILTHTLPRISSLFPSPSLSLSYTCTVMSASLQLVVTIEVACLFIPAHTIIYTNSCTITIVPLVIVPICVPFLSNCYLMLVCDAMHVCSGTPSMRAAAVPRVHPLVLWGTLRVCDSCSFFDLSNQTWNALLAMIGNYSAIQS